MIAPPPATLAQVRNFINRQGGYVAYAQSRGINHRTAERIYSGRIPAPNWLLAELAAEVRA